MQRPQAVDQFKHPVYEFLSLSIAQAAQNRAATEMIVAIRITAWAPQRTFTSNFDGERRSLSIEKFSPGTNHLGRFHDKSVSRSGPHSVARANRSVTVDSSRARGLAPVLASD